MKQRLIWADSLKGLLMLLVVLGHAIQYTLGNTECENNHVWNYIYSFNMPAFMAVSGYLSWHLGGGTNRLNIVQRRFLQLLVPYFLWELIYIISSGISINSLTNIFIHPYFWFLWVLFFIVVSFQFGDWLAEQLKLRQEIVIILLGLLYILIMVIGDFRLFGFQFIAYYYTFYVFGYYLHKYPKLLQIKNVVLTAIIALWACMAFSWKMHELPSFMNKIPLPSAMMQYAYRYITAFIAIYAVMSLAPRVLNKDISWNKPLVVLGQISLGIYVVHLLLMPYITRIVGVLIENDNFVIVLSFIIACVISWVTVSLLNKCKWTACLLLGRI